MSGKQARAGREAIRAWRQRIEDMSTVEVRVGGGGKPWRLLRDVDPEAMAEIPPSSDGHRDERVFLMYCMQQGYVRFVETVPPDAPVAFRLGGQYRHHGGWEATPGLVALYLAGAAPGTPVPDSLRP